MKEVTTSYQVKKGDQLQFEYTIQTLWSEDQIKSILDRVNTDPKLSVLDYEIVTHNWQDVGVYGEYGMLLDKLVVKIEVLQNPFPVMILIAMIVATGGLYFLSLTLDKVYLISESIPETVKTGLSMVTILGGVFIGYLALRGQLFK
jgi:hypothetical protein